MDGAAFAVAEHLNFDVARPLQIFLEIKRIVAERGLGLGTRRNERRGKLAFRRDDPHAAAAAAGRRLEHQRIADVARQIVGFRIGADAAVGAGHDRNAEFLGGAFGRDLVAHQSDMFGAGSDEVQIVLGENLGKPRVLGEKAIAGMHRVGARDLAGGKQSRNIEVAVLGGGRPDADALVCQPHMHRVFIGRRVHGHRGNAELLAGPQHPQRDFPAVGDEDLVEHRSGSTRRMANSE